MPLLESLEDFLQSRREFDGSEELATTLGPLFRGLESDWERLRTAVSWCDRLRELCGEERAREIIDDLGSQVAALEAAQREGLEVVELRESLERLESVFAGGSAAEPWPGDAGLPLAELRERVEETFDLVRSTNESIAAGAIAANATFGEITGALDELWKVRSLRAELVDSPLGEAALGEDLEAFVAKLESARVTRQWARKVLALPFPLEWRRWLLGAPREDRAVALFAQRNTWHERLVALRRFLSDFGELGASEPGGPFDPDHLDRTPLEVVERLEDCQKGLPWLGAWARYCRVKRRALEAGLAAIVEAGEWGELPPEGLDVAFSHSLYDRLARELLESDDQLATFDRVRHEKARREFRRADVATMRWCRWEISRSLAQRQPPAGVGRGPVREWTELALIRRECDKKRRHVPIRQLVRRAGEALQSLQPCWMMSPLSVAQFLPPGEIEFDLVVMDEASQIRPEDALGALARGRQTVIVGDTRQMPPTRFFQRTGEELDEVADEDAGSAEELESVLEAAAKCYPSSMLKWHYRSEHQRLIEFSNRAYYGGELVVFPSRYREHPQLGVQWRFVEGAVFTRRRNEVEARAVVDAILEHARDNLERAERDRESLGVATMNLHQRDLVLDLLDEESSQDERTREAIEALESFGEPLFVKNLENVQGDERDVIFVSCTYGRDAQSGKVAQRFGPLVQGGGHRRLNVLLTRARKRVVVFSSMRAEDIEGGEGKARGVNDLKRYLEFAESGAAAGDGGRVRPEGERSAFEQSVGRALASLGYEAVRRVGIAGCHVDLGVLDPDDEQTLLLGIDGDGPSYHRAACARDRERLRDEVLARRGWKLHRLWSVDWLSNHSSERERLHQALEQARQR